jgi:hypothetical protein
MEVMDKFCELSYIIPNKTAEQNGGHANDMKLSKRKQV